MKLTSVVRNIRAIPAGNRSPHDSDDEPQHRYRTSSLRNGRLRSFGGSKVSLLSRSRNHLNEPGLEQSVWDRKFNIRKSLRRKAKSSEQIFKEHLPFKKSLFGATLDEVMDLQKDTHPNNHIPWILPLLADKIVELNGRTTEGIFRVPGDIDRVASLKVSIDNGDYANEFPTQDPSVCASLLKEWLREMYDPVIPNDVYQHCLDNCDKANYCSSIVTDLPDVNRLVLTYTIRFLQSFVKDDVIGHTKMTADNLAMVFAPNLLRCQSKDLQAAMDNAKWEMTFVRTLINNLDTTYMEGVI